MSKHANPTLIGGFVVGAVILVLAGIMIFGSGAFLQDRPRYVLFFEGGVGGLNVGAPVTFRGVRIGAVSNIQMVYDSNDMTIRIPVIIEIDPEKIVNVQGDFESREEANEAVKELIEQGLRAKLNLQSLVTGQLSVEFDFYPNREPRYSTGEAGSLDIEYMELPTVPSEIEKITSTLEELPLETMVAKVVSTLDGIERMINSKEMIDSLQSFSAAMQDIEKLATTMSGEVAPLAGDIDQLVKGANEVVVNLNEALTGISTDARQVLGSAENTVEQLNTNIEPVVSSLENVADAARVTLQQVQATLSSFEGITSRDSTLGYKLYSALEEFEAAARSIRVMAEYLERNPEALLRGKGGF